MDGSMVRNMTRIVVSRATPHGNSRAIPQRSEPHGLPTASDFSVLNPHDATVESTDVHSKHVGLRVHSLLCQPI